MKKLIDLKDYLKDKFKHLLTIKKLPVTNRGKPTYGLLGVDTITDARKLVLSQLKKEKLDAEINDITVFAKILMTPHLFDPVEKESITFGFAKKDTLNYTIVGSDGVNYHIHGVDVKAYLKEDECIRHFRANDGTNVFAYITDNGKKAEVLFYRKGDTNGKKIVNEYIENHYGHVMVKTKTVIK